MSVHVYAAMIRSGVHFAEASYRDGEWRAILGHQGRNVDGTEYRAVGPSLARTLTDHAGQWCAFWPEGDVADDVRADALQWRAERCPDVPWLPDRIVGRANERGEAGPFFGALRTRRVLIVGPAHLANLPESVVGRFIHVEVPGNGSAWRDVAGIAGRIRREVWAGDVVLFSAGMASNLLIASLWRDPNLRHRVTLFDAGAMLDPYCGIHSRRLFRDAKWRRDIMPRNLA